MRTWSANRHAVVAVCAPFLFDSLRGPLEGPIGVLSSRRRSNLESSKELAHKLFRLCQSFSSSLNRRLEASTLGSLGHIFRRPESQGLNRARRMIAPAGDKAAAVHNK